LYDQVLTEKNNLLTQELEQCRAQLNAATAELEKSKKDNHMPVAPETESSW